jgi:hypothetical protein
MIVVGARGLCVPDEAALSFSLNNEKIESSVINNRLSTPTEWKM